MLVVILVVSLALLAAWLHGYGWGKATGKQQFLHGYRAAVEDGWGDLWDKEAAYEKLQFEHERLKEQLAAAQKTVRERVRPHSGFGGVL